MAYKIQSLVESGFDFGQVYPEKQQAVRENTGLDFDLSGVVKFLQRQTNNFTTENPIAQDLDNAVFAVVSKWQSEAPAPAPETPSAPAEKSQEEINQEVKEAIEVLEMLGDDLNEEQKEALDILKSLI